ncbi:NAD-binding protein, partial [Acinetobacter baumannii]
ADDLHGSVLLIGFGRVGQIVGQNILARGCEISVIETSTETIRNAADYGFKVYYGDGSRLDVLHAAGAGSARAIVVCIDDAEAATRIV